MDRALLIARPLCAKRLLLLPPPPPAAVAVIMDGSIRQNAGGKVMADLRRVRRDDKNFAPAVPYPPVFVVVVGFGFFFPFTKLRTHTCMEECLLRKSIGFLCHITHAHALHL